MSLLEIILNNVKLDPSSFSVLPMIVRCSLSLDSAWNKFSHIWVCDMNRQFKITYGGAK